MSRYDKIPKINPDYSKGFADVAEQWMKAYFAVRTHCGNEIFRGEMWRLAAIVGWGLFSITGVCLAVVGGA